MSRSLREKLSRAERRLAIYAEKTVACDAARAKLEAEVADLMKRRDADLAFCRQIEAQIKRRDEDGLLRARSSVGDLSRTRPTRLKQVLAEVCRMNNLPVPSWLKDVNQRQIQGLAITDLVGKYVISDAGIAPAADFAHRQALGRQVKAMMSLAKAAPTRSVPPSTKPDDLAAIHPAFNLERALELAVAGRAEFCIADERAVTVTKRNLLARTAFCRCIQINADWLEDSASRLAARVRPDGGRESPDGSEIGKLANAIEIAVSKDKVRSLAHQENDARLLNAVAIFATPGAMTAAYHRGLSADQRAFCAEWFSTNRDLATRLGYRVGTEALFAELEKDSGPFRARHGAAPKFAPATSRIWARKVDSDVAFQGIEPTELVQQARHVLMDLTLFSHLVSLPKARDAFLHFGAWQGAEALHTESVDVGQVLTKAFISRARDAAEVQTMQGTNPLAMTAGLVTWKSSDDVERQAPLFLAMISLDETAKTIHRLSDFVLNRALLRRIAIEYPALAGSKDSFDALLGDVAVASPLGAVFERVAAAINVGAPVGGKPILKIEDECLVGVFDSARSVLERRLNLSVFPNLVDNPVVRLLALGAKATGKDRIVEGEFDPKGARSRPDEIQALAVKASLGGTSFVLEGPPGTGKTETIAAMVEVLSKQGKRVLVSAAMPGAVEVIGRRLRGVVRFVVWETRSGQIDIGDPGVKVESNKDWDIHIGTPLALTKELAADDKFDVLIIDEASQLRLSHALALCGHVGQIIVAGDSRQLQPRDADVDVVSESSLLARARLAGLPTIALERHYRSRHPSLIAWSDAFSYESKLKPNIGPYLLGDAGFEVVYLGATRRLMIGEVQINVEEAEAIAAECLKWARDGRRTVGVAALTQGQRDLIRETVERELGQAGLSAASAGPDNKFFSVEEPFFIRTAGAVQGEERDVMIVSLGVAPNAQGKISQHVGALSRPDGLAVANVLLSRARLRTVVYSSVLPWEINLAAMTPGMFLIASMLRMATVVGAPAKVIDEPIHDNFISDQWTTHRLEVEGEPVFGLVHRDAPDRYAVGVCFWEHLQHGQAINLLQASGWKMTFGDISALHRRDFVLRRDIEEAMAAFVAANVKKSEQATV